MKLENPPPAAAMAPAGPLASASIELESPMFSGGDTGLGAEFTFQGQLRRDGRGLFAAALLAAFPNLPIEDEGRLKDPGLRESFLERVFAYRRLGG